MKLDLAKCGGTCRSDCKHYEIGVACGAEQTYEQRKEKQQPSGYIARCQCGNVVGAMDITRTDRKEAGKLLSQWLSDGCTVEPRFGGSWSETVYNCGCI